MHYLSYILILVFGLLIGCEKDKLPVLPDNNSPIYNVKGSISGKEFSYEAGVNGMFMETSFSSLRNVIQHNAHLNNEINHFNISFADANLDIPSSSINYTSITELNLANIDIDNLVVLNKSIFTNQEGINSVSWTIDGVEQSNEEVNITEPGVYSICATVNFNNGLQKELSNDLILGYKKNTSFGIRHFINQDDYVNCFVDVPEADIESITWIINGDEYSISNAITFLLEPEYYQIEARIQLKNGVERVKRFFIDGNDPNNYIEDFSVEENQIQEHFWDLKARISLKLNGELWVPINNNDKILISEIKEDGKNDGGQTVYKIKGLFDGMMLNENTQQEAEGSFEFTLAFAIP